MNTASPFAPPRAGRAAGFWRVWFRLCRDLRLGVFRLPPGFRLPPRPWMPFAVVCVPLLGLRYSRHHGYLRIAAFLFALFGFVALGAYGQLLGSIAFGLTIAIHAAGVAAYLDLESPAVNVGYRIGRQLVLAFVLALVAPVIVGRVMERFVIPVAGPDGALLINPLARTHPLLPGEIVAYALESFGEGGFRLQSGVYLGRVLAGPGTEVSFSSGQYSLDGTPAPALPHMPTLGQLKIEAGQSFVWPTVFLSNYNAGVRFPASRAVIPDSALVGRPYKRWFWRTQSP